MKIYNSLARKKEELVPIRDKKIGMYVCGPTVYDEPHVGHARSAYIFDMIRRYLKYRCYEVKFVRNVTDVDDKIINKAKEMVDGRLSIVDSDMATMSHEPSAMSLEDAAKEVSKRYLDSYHRDMELLGIGRPDSEPKATEYIPKMIAFIEGLIAGGAAYASGGDVYFNVKTAKSYGKLSNQNIEKMESGARVLPGENKRDGLDFALWKSAKEGEPSWGSPWGKGRPGWHIECSVMSSDILGDEFDIHGGGIDLIFPHHENEIAQSEGSGKGFARSWIHNGLLTINGEKMAKSLGNFISIQDFMKKYKDADYLKLLFLSAHYRSPVDYTEEKIEEARKEKERIEIFLKTVKSNIEKFERVYNERPAFDPKVYFNTSLKDVITYDDNFEKAMSDDFNAPQALGEIFNMIHSGNSIIMTFDDNDNDTIRYAKLKYIRDKIYDHCTRIFGLSLGEEIALSSVEKKLIEERNHFRKTKDFDKADEFRRILLKDYSIILEDTRDGTEWRRKT
ncbi:MAG: cysteine--tRNA ligase [Candidatus Omnitrophota bacterium]